jgi:hypothetical protein
MGIEACGPGPPARQRVADLTGMEQPDAAQPQQFGVAITWRPTFLSGLHLRQDAHRSKLAAAGTKAVPTKAFVFIHAPCPSCPTRSAWTSPSTVAADQSTPKVPQNPIATARAAAKLTRPPSPPQPAGGQ